MPMPTITIKKMKDGRIVSSFREAAGRVRTAANPYATNWVTADQLRELAEYAILLQKAQCAAGLGSDGSPMPPLKDQGGKVVFLGRANNRAQFGLQGYAAQKAKLGLVPMRDLYGPGKDGHMLDGIRVTYLDDKRCVISITTTSGRTKARANEQRARWWGWSPASVQKLVLKSREIFGWSTAQYLVAIGLVSANALNNRQLIRRVV